MLIANSWCFFTILAFGWFQMRSSSPVCFGSRDDTPGVFTIPFTGDVITFKLVHLFGYVNCGSTEATRSFWGCTHPNVPASHQMGTYITDPQKNRLLPKQEYVHEGWYCGQYWLPGQKPNSSECCSIISLIRCLCQLSSSLWCGSTRRYTIAVILIIPLRKLVLMCTPCTFK